jgi:hypothetical protein
MTDAPDPAEPPTKDSLGWRLVRSVFAPDVLEDGGQDAPLSPRGKFLFRGIVAVLVVAIAALFVITLSQK